MASVGQVTVYYEDGPLKDQVHSRVDAPPSITVQSPKMQALSYVLNGTDPFMDPAGHVEIENIVYHRCPCPVREECVSYFVDEDEMLDVYRQWVFDCGHPI